MWFWFWPWLLIGGASEARLREGTLSDAARIAEIHASGFAIGWDGHEIEAMLQSRHPCDVLVSRAVIGEVVTGFALSRVIVDEAELLSLALDREVRGQGLSEKLLRRHAQRLRQAGAMRLHLEVAVDNAPALALYRRLGFVETGRRKGYYPGAGGGGPRKDALNLSWDLGDFDATPRPLGL